MSYTRTNPARTTRSNRNGNLSEDWLNPASNTRSARSSSLHDGGASAPHPPLPSHHHEPPTPEQHGAYSVKKPDPLKREKIQHIAAAETRAYNQYKQERKQVRYVTTNTSVGSSSGPQSTVGRGAVTLPAPPAINTRYGGTTSVSTGTVGAPSRNGPALPRSKPISLKAQTARMEDPEIERRKAEQRRKAEALKLKQDERQRRLDMDRRQKNNQFLNRVSNGSL